MLAGGDTRPATVRWVGLPLTVVVPLVMAVPMTINLVSSWRGRFVAFGIEVVAVVFFWALLRHDHNALRILVRWLRTKCGSFDAQKWKGAAPDPFPYRPSKSPHGIYDD